MSEEEIADVPEVSLDSYHNALLELFDEMSFSEKWERVREGLKMPPDSGEYKFAKLQILRLSAPIAGVMTVVVALLFLLLMSIGGEQPARNYEVAMQEPEKLEKELEPPEPEPPPPDQPPPEPTEVVPDIMTPGNANMPGPPGPSVPFSPQPASFDTVAMIKSPIVMRGIYAGRSPGQRGSLLGRGGGGSMTEDAVMKALRWLKKNQNQDGSWPATKPAMTGLALLSYLAHGETPASEEFGYTVEKAIQYLISSQQGNGHFAGHDGHDYSHPIAAYALSEAYGMTKVPQIKEAAKKAIQCIIDGQHASGGFNYNLNADNRDDSSYMGWCAQAMKAADIAYVMDEPEKLKAAMRKAIDGFRKNYSAGGGGGDNAYAQGGFGYTSPGIGGLTGVGALCMQLLGAAKSKEVSSSIETMKGWTFAWNQKDFGGTIYYAYYSTQAKFHEGGEQWTSWNKQFSPALCKNQTVISKAIENTQGKLVDIGYWDSDASGHSDGGEGKRVMTTCLCTLMLEVYYRYLPTYSGAAVQQEIQVDGGAPGANNKKENNEVKIDVGGI